jgi:hypothetical protein
MTDKTVLNPNCIGSSSAFIKKNADDFLGIFTHDAGTNTYTIVPINLFTPLHLSIADCIYRKPAKLVCGI